MDLLTRAEEILLMAIWRLQNNAYGVSIRKELAILTGKNWSVGAIYAPLHRLQNNGYVQSKMGEPFAERGGRSKVFYELTSSGKKALVEVKQLHGKLWKNAPHLGLEKKD